MEDFWRYGYLSDFEEEDDDDAALCEDKPIGKWLQAEKTQGDFAARDVRRLAAICENAGKRYMKYVTSEVIMTDFDWRSSTLILEVLGDDSEDSSSSSPTSRHCFNSTPWCRDDVSIIAAWPGWALGCTIFHGAVAHLLLFNCRDSTVEEVGSWNLEQYWARLTLTMGRVSSQPEFACVLSPTEKLAVITGPPLFDSMTPATKVLDIQRKAFVKDISVEGFTWIAAAAFHPTDHRKMALICCKTYDTVDNYARPNVTGTLVNFDLMTGGQCSGSRRKGVSSETLKFSRTGDVLFVRFNNNRCIAILDADDFRCYQTIAHDVSQFPPNHSSFCTAYRLFPLISRDNTKVATLQWVNNREVMRTTNVLRYKVQTLKCFCRQTIVRELGASGHLPELSIPKELKEYLLWM